MRLLRPNSPPSNVPADDRFPAAAGTAAAAALQKLRAGVDDVVIATVGDSTAGLAQTNSWGPRIIAAVGAQYPAYTVKRYEWNSGSVGYDSPVTVQTGTGSKTLHWYNGSAPGQPVQYSLTNWAALVPAAPDLFLLNHGHNNGESVTPAPPSAPGFRAIYLQLIRKATRGYPRAGVVVVAQNPKTSPRSASEISGHAQRAQVIAQLAATEDCGLVDMYSAVQAAVAAGTLIGSLVASSDGIHPTAAGYDLWLAEALKQFPTQVPTGARAPRRAVDRIMLPSASFQPVQGTATAGYASEDQYFVRYGSLLSFPDNAFTGVAAWVQIPDHWETFTLTVLWSSPVTSGAVVWRTFLRDYKPGAAAYTGAYQLGGFRDLTDIPQGQFVGNAPASRSIAALETVSGYPLPADSTRLINITLMRQGDAGPDTLAGVAELHAVVVERTS